MKRQNELTDMEKVIRAKELMKTISHYGPLHIVVADDNIEDEHLLFCLLECIKQGFDYDSDEVEFIELMMDMDMFDRVEIVQSTSRTWCPHCKKQTNEYEIVGYEKKCL